METENPLAFPSLGEGYGNPSYHAPGMTLRDYFAAAALAALLPSPAVRYSSDGSTLLNCDLAATRAYELADAMLTERGKK